MRPFFSIIVPAYNSENHIYKCIYSVLNQNFLKNEYEILIIEDSSKDKTLEICKKIKKRFNNIRIFSTKKNKGVSNARNIGINIAKGRYIIFLDSDDQLISNSLNKIKKILYKNNLDLLLTVNFTSKKKYIDKKILFKLLNKDSKFTAHCWNYILNIDFIKKYKIYFKKYRVYEDQIFSFKILFLANKIKLYKGSFHNHDERFGSLSRSVKFTTVFSSLKIINDLCIILRKERLSYDQKKFLYSRIIFMVKLFKTHLLICNKNQIDIITHYISKNIKNFMLIKSNSLKKISYNKINKNINNLISVKFYKKFSKIYIFGIGEIGRVVFHIFNKKNIKIEAFLDNNKNFYDKKYFNTRILNPFYLSNHRIKKIHDILIVACIDDNKILNKIRSKFIANGLKSSNFQTFNQEKII